MTAIPIISIALYLGMDVAYMRNATGVKDAPLAERQRAFSMSFGMVVAFAVGWATSNKTWVTCVQQMHPHPTEQS